MTPRQLSVAFAFFSYGGNGGISSEHPDIRTWYADTLLKARSDPRISSVHAIEESDTPIPMSRNMSVLKARAMKADVLVMVDSDQKPDMYLGHAGVKPFFESSFEFIYDRYERGPHVVGAPYCGPPPNELVYVFKWSRQSSLPTLANDAHFGKYERGEAALLSGIQPCGGLPTGLIMYDMRIFDLTEPLDCHPKDAKGWFYYEWKDKYAAEKASTEDGSATRDMSMIGYAKMGYNPVHCNWDAWAGHWKPYCVPKPGIICAESMTDTFIKAAREGVSASDQLRLMGSGDRNDARDDFFAKEMQSQPERHVVPFDSGFGQRLGPLVFGEKYESAVSSACGFAIAMNTPEDMRIIRGLVGSSVSGVHGWRGVEVGTWFGDTAKVICEAIDAKKSGALLYCVDTWAGSPGEWTGSMAAASTPDELFVQFSKNCQEYLQQGCICPQRLPSLDAAPLISDGRLDFVFIDANHEYEAVKADIEAWLPKVRKGGILCGHDYSDGPLPGGDGKLWFPGVKQAVDEAFGDRVNKPVSGSSVWWIQV